MQVPDFEGPLVLGERLSRSWCGIERPGHREERGSWEPIMIFCWSFSQWTWRKKKKNSIIQIEETLKCCCKLVFARLVQAVMVTPSSRHTHRAFGISNKVQSIMWIFGHITLSHITQGKHLGHQVNSFHKYDVRSQRRLERCGSLHRGASMCHLGLFVSLLRQLCWTN